LQQGQESETKQQRKTAGRRLEQRHHTGLRQVRTAHGSDALDQPRLRDIAQQPAKQHRDHAEQDELIQE
jgi:hypothetical protein